MTTDITMKIIGLAWFAVILDIHGACGISNPYDKSTIYMRPPNDRGPRTWESGLKCLETTSALYLSNNNDRYKLATSNQDMIIAIAANMTSPAAQIQEEYLKLKNKMSGDASQHSVLGGYLLRIVSDATQLPKQTFNAELVTDTYAYVMVVDNVNRLRRLLRSYTSKVQSWNPGARFLVLYHHVNDRNRSLIVANQIFDILLNQFYVNTASLLYAINSTTYEYYILDNFNSDACRKVKADMVAMCTNGFILNQALVQYRTKRILQKSSLRNCTFDMCIAIAAPFIEKDCVSGIELQLIDVIKTKLGFELNVSCGNYRRGVRIPENDTWTELLGLLDNRICDFILGGFYPDDEVLEDFWATDTYLSNSHTWFTAKAAIRPPWKALFTIFQGHMWACMAVVLLITWISWLTFGCILPEMEAHKSPSLTAINSWGVTLGAAVSERPQCLATQIFFVGLCVYSMNVTSLYTSKLISVFANPGYEHQISTIDEVIRQDIPFGGPAESRDWFENDDDIEIYARYNDSDYFQPRTHNLRAIISEKRVILANRMLVLRSPIVEHLYGFPQNVFTSPVEIITKRGFPFLNRFNILIRQMKFSGLFDKIVKDFLYHYNILVKIRQQRAEYREAVIVLTLHHLEGAFAFWIFGILLSVLAFTGEQINFAYIRPWMNEKCNSHAKSRKRQLKRKDKPKIKHPTKQKSHKDETRPVINVRIEQIRLTPVKRRKIQFH